MDVEAIEYLVNMGAAFHKVDRLNFKLREQLDRDDGTGDYIEPEELAADPERVKRLVRYLKDHIINVDAAIYCIRPSNYDL